MIMWRRIIVHDESDIEQMKNIISNLNKSMKESADKLSSALAKMAKDLSNDTKET